MTDGQSTSEGDKAAASTGRVEIPVIVVATSPITTVVLDEADSFEPTLAQINDNTYDRLKICHKTIQL